MIPEVKIDKDQTLRRGLLLKNPVNYYITFIDAFVFNPFNGVRTDLPKRFLLDTGAAITILNRQFNNLFEDGKTPLLDNTKILYGGGAKVLPVYNVELKIDGFNFKTVAAHDSEMYLDSLLGHYGFINDFRSINMSGQRKKFSLIK